jgi:hypothetical protein
MTGSDNDFGGFDPGDGMDAFGGYGQDLGVTSDNFGDLGGYGMDAFGGYGSDLGMSTDTTTGFDYSLGIDPGNGWGAISYNDDPSLGPNAEDDSLSGKLSAFFGTPFGKAVNMALSLNPGTRAAMGLANAGLAATRGNLGPAVGAGVSALTGNSIAGGLANLGTQAVQGRDVSSSAGSMVGGLIGGSATGSPLGGMVGSQIGGMVGQSMGSSTSGGQSTNSSIGGQGTDFGGALANIADIYSANRASRDVKSNIANLESNTPQVSLESLYGPNSPYAAQLRQQLERKDAASGRRSQYGPREVELQARLAEMYSKAAPSFMQANIQNQNAIAQQRALQSQRRNQTLASIYGLARNSGVFGGIGNTFQNAGINNNLNYIDNIVPDSSLNNYIPSGLEEYF